MASLPNARSLFLEIQQLERHLREFDEARETAQFSSVSADGRISAVANGTGRLVSVSIDPALVAEQTSVALAVNVTGEINAALAAADGASEGAAQAFAQGLALPGLPAFGASAPNFPLFGTMASRIQASVQAMSPCGSSKQFQCRKSPVVAIVDAKRRLVSLAFDEPLPDHIPYLEGRIVAAVNCAVDQGTERPDDTTDTTVDIINSSSGFGQMVLYANGDLRVADRAAIKTVDCEDWGLIANAGSGETNIGVETDVGEILSLAKVVVRDRGRVHGEIRTAEHLEQQNLTEIEGPVTEQAVVVVPELAFDVDFPGVPSGTVELEPQQQQTIGPGYYSKLQPKTGAQVFMSSGTYYFNEVFLEPGSRVELNATNGPIVIWVRDGFTFRGKFEDSAGGFPRLFVGYLGTSTAVIDAPFEGTVAAPDARIYLISAENPKHAGAFHGKHIDLQPGSEICHRPFELLYDELPGLVPPAGPSQLVDFGFSSLEAWSSPQVLLVSATGPTDPDMRVAEIGSAPGRVDINSIPFAAAQISDDATRVLVDLWVPTNQPNPSDVGQLRLTMRAGTLGPDPVVVGDFNLIGLPQGEFTSVEFALSPEVMAVISSEDTDLSVQLTLDVTPGSGPWYLDAIRFLAPSPPPPAVHPVLSFEDAANWSSSQATLEVSAEQTTHGASALKIAAPPSYSEITSVNFDTAELSASQRRVLFDVWVPSNQPNPSWVGAIQMMITIPSSGLYSAWIGAAELTPLPRDAYSTVQLSLPQPVADAINAGATDCSVKFVLNINQGSGPYYLDNIRFE